jgi:succinyl-CoA synthetase beta subunit
MRLYEFEAKEIFKKHGIPVPEGQVVERAEEVVSAFSHLKPAVIKSQVLIGGRGKAGGIKFPENEVEARRFAEELLGLSIKGYQVKKLLVEKKIAIDKELYSGITIDRSEGRPILLASARGGMDVEEIAKKYPQEMIREKLDVQEGLPYYKSLDFSRRMGLRGKNLTDGAKILGTLYEIFERYDAEIVEINPLVKTADGDLIAADAKINIDEEALWRHPELRKEDEFLSDLEREARRNNLGYVEMDGNIGVIGNGAGLNMTTLDILRYYGGEPANFLEVSGRTYMLAEKAIELVLKRPGVKAVFGNFFGSISRCDVIAEGLAKFIRDGKLTKPMIVSMRGNGAEEGKKILRDVGIEVYEDDQIAGEKVVEMAKSLRE